MKIQPFASVFCFVVLFLVGASIGQEKEHRDLFRKWDRNRDGALSRQEVPNEVRGKFADVDKNRDGRISWQEHMQSIKDDRPPRNKERGTDDSAVLSHWKHADIQQISIRQTWPQETSGFDRTAIISQPKHARGKLPVVMFFHGAGGNAVGPMRQWEFLTYDCVVVSAQGYRKTWNIHGEPSKAPDVEFFKRLLNKLETDVPVANLDDVSLIGFSNGSGFIHRLLIEVDEPFSKRNFLLGSSLIEQQYHDGSFWKPTKDTDRYDKKVKPKSGRMMAYFHGTDDRVVPYHGGNRGRFPHLSAEQTAFAWAKANGYQSKQLAIKNGQPVTSSVLALNYPGTEVTLYRVTDGGHGFEPHQKDVRQIIKKLLNQ